MSKSPKSTDGIRAAQVRPIKEGYVEKGGVNSSGSFDRRPPPPAAMKPASSNTTPTNNKPAKP